MHCQDCGIWLDIPPYGWPVCSACVVKRVWAAEEKKQALLNSEQDSIVLGGETYTKTSGECEVCRDLGDKSAAKWEHRESGAKFCIPCLDWSTN